MVHWVYVLKSSTTGAIYVGETIRLYRRWHEHSTGRGGVTTSRDNYDTLIGLYHVPHNIAFSDFCSGILSNPIGRTIWKWDQECDKTDALQFENDITKRYMHDNPNINIKGGSYCRRSDWIVNLSDVVIDRPLCKCGYPCEVNMKKDKSKIYFTCPIPDWVDYGYEIPNKCDFWKEYKEWNEMKEESDHRNRVEYARSMRQVDLAAFIKETNDEFTNSSRAR